VTIRDATKLGGSNLWVLMFVLVIASVGLNQRSLLLTLSPP
jgi:hypothetical protein